MNLASMKPILDLAEEKGIAYGAYVTVSYDSALAAIEAGSELNVPVIFITGTDCCDLMGGFAGTVETVKRAAANTLVPIALHLDHCRTYEECVQAINAGYSSVMIDGSSLPFDENVALTKRVVEYAHPLGISVEGELGKLVGEEGNLIVKGPEGAQTDPDEAQEFVRRTGVDCLAVSIGHPAWRVSRGAEPQHCPPQGDQSAGGTCPSCCTAVPALPWIRCRIPSTTAFARSTWQPTCSPR